MRQPEKKQIRVECLGDKTSHRRVGAFVSQSVINRRRESAPQPPKDVRERKGLTQIPGFEIERENVIANGHAKRERQGALVRRLKLLGIRAHVVEPPRVSLVEP